MNVFVTLVSTEGSLLHVFNGFSFIRNRVEGVDVFLDQTKTSQEEASMIMSRFPSDAKIFCSVSVPSNWFFISPLVDERWILGGPLVPVLLRSVNKCRGVLFDGHAEEYFGLPYLPSISYYFEDFVIRHPCKSVYICATLGSGCYWGKCRFCSHVSNGCNMFAREGTERLLGQLRRVGGKKTKVFTGFSSTPSDVLRLILQSGAHRRVSLKSFVRAEEVICDVVEEFSDLKGFVLVVGAESFSQRINDILQKGTSWDVLLRLIESVASRGGRVQLDTMEHYPFIKNEDIEEANVIIPKLEKLRDKFPKSYFILNFGPTIWHDEVEISAVCDKWTSHIGILGETWFLPVMSEEAIRLNARMNRMVSSRLGVTHSCPKGGYAVYEEE